MKNFTCFFILTVIIFSCSACGNNTELEELKKENADLRAQLAAYATTVPATQKSKKETASDGTISNGNIDISEFEDCLSDGIYRCGTDMDSGDYYILSPDGNAGYEVTDSPNAQSWSGHARILKKYILKRGSILILILRYLFLLIA